MILEIIGVLSGLLYVFLEIKKKSLMWLVGIVMAAVYIVIFAQSKLYAAMGLQFYYLGISAYGWWKWRKDGQSGSSGQVRQDDSAGQDGLDRQDGSAGQESMLLNRFDWKVGAVSAGLTVVLFVLMAFVFSEYTGNAQPVLDSLIAALSAMGTYWLSRSYIQQWYIWIGVNILSVVMFLTQGLYATSGLYFVYILAAIYGYYHWRKCGVYPAGKSRENPAGE